MPKYQNKNVPSKNKGDSVPFNYLQAIANRVPTNRLDGKYKLWENIA